MRTVRRLIDMSDAHEIEMSVGEEIITVFHGGSTVLHIDKCFATSERFAETYGDVSVFDIDLTGLSIATIGDEDSRFDTGGYPGDSAKDFPGVDVLKYWDLAQDSDRIAGWCYRIWSAAAVAATICEE